MFEVGSELREELSVTGTKRGWHCDGVHHLWVSWGWELLLSSVYTWVPMLLNNPQLWPEEVSFRGWVSKLLGDG